MIFSCILHICCQENTVPLWAFDLEYAAGSCGLKLDADVLVQGQEILSLILL